MEFVPMFPEMEKSTEAVKIHQSWFNKLENEFNSLYFNDLRKFLYSEKEAGNRIYPPGKFIFNAFEKTPFDKVKVVILGQDPYHNEGQAHGLSFSVMPGIRKPPSLLKIFKELREDLGVPIPVNGNLDSWAEQGVLLLNAVLTVRANQPGSHQGKGWENFTDAVIRTISSEKKNVVFMLWGRFAKAKRTLIDESRHHILEAAHPSPLAREGFAGCRHFSMTNRILKDTGVEPVDWGKGLH